MTGKTTKVMLDAYYQDASPIPYFRGQFRATKRNFYNSEEIEIDIERSGEKIATPVQAIDSDGNINTFDEFTNKNFKPPVLKEVFALNGFSTIHRTAGQNPFDDPNYRTNAFAQIAKGTRLVENMIERTIELQCSQVLQTGKVTLSDGTNDLYTIDFKPKATHFPTASTIWSDDAATRIDDLHALAKEISKHGQTQANRLQFGSAAWLAFVTSQEIRDYADNRRLDLTAVAPHNGPNGGVWQGYIWIAGYRFEMWTYEAFYDAPGTGTSTEYLDPGKVIMTAEGAMRLDMTYGAIPQVVAPDPRLRGLVPARIFRDGRIGLSTNVYTDQKGEAVNVQVGTRPLPIPTSIDRFGCIDTGV